MKYCVSLSVGILLVLLDVSYCKHAKIMTPETGKVMSEHTTNRSHQRLSTSENSDVEQSQLTQTTTEQSPIIPKNIMNLLVRKLIHDLKTGRVKVTKRLDTDGKQPEKLVKGIDKRAANPQTLDKENIRRRRSPHGRCRRCRQHCGGGWCGGGYMPQWQYQPHRTCNTCNGGGGGYLPQFSYSQSFSSSSAGSFSGR